MTVLLALGSALAYGLSDFVGGLLSRHTQVWSVAVVAQLSSSACTLVVAVAVAGTPTGADHASGVLAGIGVGLGTAFLYRGLAQGRMSVVAPLSAVGSALLPTVVALGTGERLAFLTWIGVACAFPAIWLVSRSAEVEEDLAAPGAHDTPDGRETVLAKARRTGVVDGLLAGAGFGVLFAALGQVSDGGGLWPLFVAQAVSVPVVVLLATTMRARWWPRDRYAFRAAVVGPLAAVATGLFFYATQSGLLTISAVLSSLYPASTVLLAAILLHERIQRGQAVGLVLAAIAVSLVAAG